MCEFPPITTISYTVSFLW